MRSSKSRSRNKSNRNRSIGNIVNRVFDSSGPEGKVRGTPQQIIDKYLQLARDAQLSNDRVATENFQQHAEHYTRMLGEAMREQEARREAQQESHNNQGGNGNQSNQQGGNQNRQRNERDSSNDPGSAPQPDTNQPAMGGNDVMDMSDNKDSGLVETPEMESSSTPKARAQRRPRRSKQQQSADSSDDNTPPSDQPQEATG